jgi:hypothetical protein
MGKRLIRKLRRLFFDRRAISSVISNVLLASVVLGLGFAVQYYVYWRSVEYNRQYGALVDDSIAKIKEKLVFEHIFYNASDYNLTVYLMNCGRINDASIATVTVSLSNGSWLETFYEEEIKLKFPNGTQAEGLDILEEGYFQLPVGLVDDRSYAILIVTGRGKAFVTNFTA